MKLPNEQMFLSNEQYKELSDLVYNYPVKHREGFIGDEQRAVMKIVEEKFWKLDMDKYWDAQRGITCVMSNDGLVIYHCDVLLSLVCGLEARDQTAEEWD